MPVTAMLRIAEATTEDTDDVGSSEPSFANLHKFDNFECEYGTMISEFQFKPDTSKDEIVNVPYINPFTLLHWSGANSIPFLQFLRTCLGGLMGNMIFYADEVAPGNNKRHDGGRKYVAMYWSLL